jgi:hypothetical protein
MIPLFYHQATPAKYPSNYMYSRAQLLTFRPHRHEDLSPVTEIFAMAMSSFKFAVGVAGALLVTLLMFSGKTQSKVDVASLVYPVNPQCEGQFNLAYRIDWAHEAYEGGSAQRAVKQGHKICD